MMTSWAILYRGPLSSCNYECDYCPFAKTQNTREELLDDKQRLTRFQHWVEDRPEDIGILFTPWGEALVRRYYQKALCDLSHLKNVRRVAIQTNLSSNLRWVVDANRETLALWCTYHPSQISRAAFLDRLQVLREAQVRFSVGIVGAREHSVSFRG